MTAPIAALLQPIKDRLKAATPGPWEWGKEEDVWGDCGPNLETTARGPVYSDGSQGAEVMVIGSWGHDANGIDVAPNDAAFIAAAPTDQAKLIAAVEAAALLAAGWQARGEHLRRSAKTMPEDVQDSLNEQADDMLWHARLLRSTITSALESAA